MVASAARGCPHSDQLRSNSASTNVTGTLIARLGYKPYGQTAWSTAELPAQFGYTGQRYDQGDGWIYDYGARFYDTNILRFLSADTIVPQAGNPQTFNRYAYVAGNPLKYIDPSGNDLILVPGVETDNWIDHPEQWKEWILQYTGWNGEQWLNFLAQYKRQRRDDAEVRNLLLRLDEV